MTETEKFIKVYNFYVRICERIGGRPMPYPNYKRELISANTDIDDMIVGLNL